MKKTISILLAVILAVSAFCFPVSANDNEKISLDVVFEEELWLLDYFFSLNADFMVFTMSTELYYEYMPEDFDEEANGYTYYLDGDIYEAHLNARFKVSEAQLAAIRSYTDYDEAAHAYKVYMIGGFGGSMKPREYIGFKANEDGTYYVYYATIDYDYLPDEGYTKAEELDWPYELEYNGKIYESGPDGYTRIEGLEKSGRRYTVEYNVKTGMVRLVDQVDYAESDLPEAFDHIEVAIPGSLSVEDIMKEELGEALEDAKLDYEISVPNGYFAGEELTVTVSVKNITAENGIHVAAFVLYYDSTKLLLTNDLDEEDDNALQCIKTMPDGWENFCKVANDYSDENEEGTEVKPLNDGCITVEVLTTKTNKSAAVKEDDKLVFEFTFKVLENVEGDLGFVIPHEETEGGYNTNMGADVYAANGDYAIVSKFKPVVVEAEEGVIEEDAELNIENIAPENIEEVFPLIENIPSAIVFDIFIEKNDERIQPNGELKISILAPKGTEGTALKVYHIADDGKITDMNAVFEDGYYTFTTTHLSYYMLADPNEMYTVGDVNDNGEIEKYDYILVKRAVMGTFTLDAIQQKAADVNYTETVDKYDYILVKRHVMGTFSIG